MRVSPPTTLVCTPPCSHNLFPLRCVTVRELSRTSLHTALLTSAESWQQCSAAAVVVAAAVATMYSSSRRSSETSSSRSSSRSSVVRLACYCSAVMVAACRCMMNQAGTAGRWRGLYPYPAQGSCATVREGEGARRVRGFYILPVASPFTKIHTSTYTQLEAALSVCVDWPEQAGAGSMSLEVRSTTARQWGKSWPRAPACNRLSCCTTSLSTAAAALQLHCLWS